MRCLFVVPAAIIALAYMALPAQSMTFKIAQDLDEKISVIIGEGRIEQGDAERLEKIVPLANRDKFGNIPIYLNSLGGEVGAAFEIVGVMDREEFSALVPSGARCASACASIVYISARFHQVLGTGALGIHTCYRRDKNSGTPEPDSFCNEVIAQSAVQHGTSHGAVQMWQENTAPEDMAWIGQDVACQYGLCGPPGFSGTLAIPSFDCKTAKLPSEKAICSNKRLARHEADLSKSYHELLQKMPEADKEALRIGQRAWLKYRDSCAGDAIESCLLQRMNARWSQILEMDNQLFLQSLKLRKESNVTP